MAAGGCVGSLAIIVPDPELDSIVNEHLLGKCKAWFTPATSRHKSEVTQMQIKIYPDVLRLSLCHYVASVRQI